MSTQQALSLAILLLFVVIIQVRAARMRARGIRVFIVAQGDAVLVPLILAMIYAALARPLGLPIPPALLRPLWISELPGWIGLGLCVLSLFGFVEAMKNFGDSFRVGIDTQSSGELITHGMFGISRNPVYVCFLIFFAGLFLIHRNLALALAILGFFAAIHRQILREERFLKDHYGSAYQDYCGKVRRYL